jgi:hypothetical protein
MRAPRNLQKVMDETVDERRLADTLRRVDPWKDGSRVHIVSGVSVLEAKRIVQTLGDTTFDPERAQLVRTLPKTLVDRYRTDHERAPPERPPPLPRAKAPRAPPPPPPRGGSSGLERAVMYIVLLGMLGLQLAQLVR